MAETLPAGVAPPLRATAGSRCRRRIHNITDTLSIDGDAVERADASEDGARTQPAQVGGCDVRPLPSSAWWTAAAPPTGAARAPTRSTPPSPPSHWPCPHPPAVRGFRGRCTRTTPTPSAPPTVRSPSPLHATNLPGQPLAVRVRPRSGARGRDQRAYTNPTRALVKLRVVSTPGVQASARTFDQHGGWHAAACAAAAAGRVASRCRCGMYHAAVRCRPEDPAAGHACHAPRRGVASRCGTHIG
jgi:hypothetical protein